MNAGTPRELRPIAEQVLNDLRFRPLPRDVHRRIELCALAVLEWSMFLELYEIEVKGDPV